MNINSARSLLSSKIMTESVSKLSLEDQALVVTLVKFVKSMSEARYNELRTSILEQVRRIGEPDEDPTSGARHMRLGDVDCSAEVRSGGRDEAKVKELLKAKGIPLDKGFTEVKTAVMDESKLKFLSDMGKITEEELASTLKEDTLVLKTTASKALQERLQTLLQGDAVFGEAKTEEPVGTWPSSTRAFVRCAVTTCGKHVSARGLCAAHYQKSVRLDIKPSKKGYSKTQLKRISAK